MENDFRIVNIMGIIETKEMSGLEQSAVKEIFETLELHAAHRK
jgi:hypothetical protein